MKFLKLCESITDRVMTVIIRTYSELNILPTFKERFEYLKLDGQVGVDTFGRDRYYNQIFYQRDIEWRQARRQVIIRDLGCDLGLEGYEIHKGIIIHHMNPITIEDILNRNPDIFNPEYLICTSQKTHNAIHYGDSSLLFQAPVERTKNDMCPWRHD